MTLDELAVLFDLAAGNGAQRANNSILTVLEREQLIEAGEQTWQPTERARVFIEHIASLTLPVQMWSMPGGVIVERNVPPMMVFASTIDDDGPAPPAPPLKVTRRIADPELRQREAMALMNRSYGMREIKEELELSDEDMTAYFGKWA